MSSAFKPLSKSERVQVLFHCVVAFNFFTEGLGKLEHPEGYRMFIAFCWAAALALAALTGAFVYTNRHLHHHRYLLVSIGAVEVVVCGLVALDYFGQGKIHLAYVWSSATIATGVVALVHLFIKPRPHAPK